MDLRVLRYFCLSFFLSLPSLFALSHFQTSHSSYFSQGWWNGMDLRMFQLSCIHCTRHQRHHDQERSRPLQSRSPPIRYFFVFLEVRGSKQEAFFSCFINTHDFVHRNSSQNLTENNFHNLWKTCKNLPRRNRKRRPF